MSRITAPVGEVTTPTTVGRYGTGRLRAASNSPSAASRPAALLQERHPGPGPAGSSESTTIW